MSEKLLKFTKEEREAFQKALKRPLHPQLMSLEDYEVMISDMVEAFTRSIFAAAERNRYKDRRGGVPEFTYVKGWEGFDLRSKLLEEFKEVVKDPSVHELGDLGWVLVMMLDQAADSGRVEE